MSGLKRQRQIPGTGMEAKAPCPFPAGPAAPTARTPVQPNFWPTGDRDFSDSPGNNFPSPNPRYLPDKSLPVAARGKGGKDVPIGPKAVGREGRAPGGMLSARREDISATVVFYSSEQKRAGEVYRTSDFTSTSCNEMQNKAGDDELKGPPIGFAALWNDIRHIQKRKRRCLCTG